jgi:hypothetical protein
MRRALLKTTQPEVSLSLLPLVVAGSTQPPPPPAGLFKEPSTGGDVSGEAAAGVPPLFVLAEKEEEEENGGEEEEGDELESEDGDEEEEEGEGEGSASRFSFLGELRQYLYGITARTVLVSTGTIVVTSRVVDLNLVKLLGIILLDQVYDRHRIRPF